MSGFVIIACSFSKDWFVSQLSTFFLTLNPLKYSNSIRQRKLRIIFKFLIINKHIKRKQVANTIVKIFCYNLFVNWFSYHVIIFQELCILRLEADHVYNVTNLQHVLQWNKQRENNYKVRTNDCKNWNMPCSSSVVDTIRLVKDGVVFQKQIASFTPCLWSLNLRNPCWIMAFLSSFN